MKEELTNGYVLDIETKPQKNLMDMTLRNISAPKNYKDEGKIKEYIESKENEIVRKMSTDTDLADIICVGIKKLGGEAKILTLKEFEVFIQKNPLAWFVTFNGKKFDIPIIIKQGLKNNLNLPYKKLRDMIKRFSIIGHIDLLEVICDGEWKSLDQLLQIYLGISKTPIDFELASEEEIKAHCLEDLENTEDLYNLFAKTISN